MVVGVANRGARSGDPRDGFTGVRRKAVEAYLYAGGAPRAECAQDRRLPAAARSLKRAKAAAAKVEIAPRTRPLRLPY